MLRILGFAFASLAAVAPARADTLGLLKCSFPMQDKKVAQPKGPPRVFVARDVREFQEVWIDLGLRLTKPDPIDFDREMVIGVVHKDPVAIYRVQLDNAANPTALEVHVVFHTAHCGVFEVKPARGVFVRTARSALPVRFVVDTMIDGFAATADNEGVESKPLGSAGKSIAKQTRFANREDAERAVLAQLSKADQALLVVGPLGRPMRRIPHGWNDIDVQRVNDRWVVRYDRLIYEVDMATGRVTKR